MDKVLISPAQLAGIEGGFVEVLREAGLTDAEIDKMRAEYKAQIADLQAQEKKVLGEADAEVKRLKETAQANLYQLKMDAFQNDANALLRYELSKQLNEKLRLRLFHSGPGTFWTNMEGKGTNLLLPAPGAAVPSADKPAPADKSN